MDKPNLTIEPTTPYHRVKEFLEWRLYTIRLSNDDPKHTEQETHYHRGQIALLKELLQHGKDYA